MLKAWQSNDTFYRMHLKAMTPKFGWSKNWRKWSLNPASKFKYLKLLITCCSIVTQFCSIPLPAVYLILFCTCMDMMQNCMLWLIPSLRLPYSWPESVSQASDRGSSTASDLKSWLGPCRTEGAPTVNTTQNICTCKVYYWNLLCHGDNTGLNLIPLDWYW